MLIMVPLLGTLGLVVGLAFAAGSGSEHVSSILVAMAGMLVVALVARAMARDDDRAWLPTLVLAGYAAKLIGSWVRWWVLVDYYGGSGDAVGYYGKAVNEFVHMWRDLSPPPMTVGTPAMEGLGGLIFSPYVPSFLGGFFIYATLAFLGQLLCYAAFRTSVTPRRLKLYAVAVLFVPNLVYWPSSIGKEAIMLLGIGLAAYGISKLVNEGTGRSLLPVAAGLLIAGLIRPHVAAMVCAGATLALLFAKKGAGIASFPAKRVMLLGFVGSGLAVVMLVAAANFNITFDQGVDTGQVDDFIENVEDNTGQGGSAVSGGFMTNPAQFPEAALRVLFRPLPHEAHNPPALVSSFEGTLLLLLVIWKLPSMLHRGLRIRRDPYMLFCLFYTIGFIVAFSAFLNLGLMARERSQVMPFLLAMLVALGWGPPAADEDGEPGAGSATGDADAATGDGERTAEPSIEDLLAGGSDIRS